MEQRLGRGLVSSRGVCKGWRGEVRRLRGVRSEERAAALCVVHLGRVHARSALALTQLAEWVANGRHTIGRAPGQATAFALGIEAVLVRARVASRVRETRQHRPAHLKKDGKFRIQINTK